MTQRKKRPRRDRYQLFLGVDGGGTKTNVAILNTEREVVGESSGGPSNPLRVGVENAVANIGNAIDTACDLGGLSRGDIFGCTLGLAGVRRQDMSERVLQSFRARYRIQSVTVTTDADIALYGTTFGKAGLVVIAGTGSVCLGIDHRGEKAMAGGWGPIAGDEGGGRGIAGEALHRVAKASDGRGAQTALSERAAEYFRASNVENLIGAIYAPRMDNARIAGFARMVVETALDGDAVAIEIIEEAGRELGLAAVAVIEKLRLTNEKVRIGCVGGVFNAKEILTVPMIDTINRVAPLAYLSEPLVPPAQAAALMSLATGI